MWGELNIAKGKIGYVRPHGSSTIYLNQLFGYTVSTVLLGANILRDSVLTRLENMHYAYVHCCAIMWKTVFQELRGLTNTKAILNPMELNDLYDHLWNVGVLLQSEDCLNI